MLCKIYRLRNFGKKLSQDEVQATECIAHMCVDKHPGGEPMDRLTITLQGGLAYMSLDNAKVRVTEKGLMISAEEHTPGPYPEARPQTWYCLPLTEGEPTPIGEIGPRIRSVPVGSYI